MGQSVPKDDLPSNLVPASDLPSAASPAPKETPVTGTEGGFDKGRLIRALALPGGLAGEGAIEAGKLMERGAGKAGEAVTDLVAASSGKHSLVNPYGLKIAPEVSAGMGYATNVGLQAGSALLGGSGGARLGGAMEREARGLMSSALKPDKFARESGSADRAITTLLDKGYNVTQGGMEKMTAAIDKLDDQLEKVLANARGDVSTLSVVKPLKDAVAKFKDGLDHAENAEAIRKEALKFFDHPEVQQALQIPVQTAQRIKRAIYRELGDKAYGMGLKPQAQAEGKKAVARGLKEGIERAAPGAEGVNKEMGDLINARDLVQQRVGTAANRDILGLGAFAIRHPLEFLTWMANRNELAKSVAARALHSTPGAIPTAGGATAGGALGAVEGRRER